MMPHFFHYNRKVRWLNAIAQNRNKMSKMLGETRGWEVVARTEVVT